MYVCMYVCMHACMHVSIYIYIYMHTLYFIILGCPFSGSALRCPKPRNAKPFFKRQKRETLKRTSYLTDVKASQDLREPEGT